MDGETETWKIENSRMSSYQHEKLCESEILYSEGGLRPYWRGKFHLVVGLCFFLAFFVLVQKAETTTEMLSTLMFSVVNMVSYTVSYSYHCINWTPQTEILMEKVDHIMIYLNTANNITQLSFLAIKNNRLLIACIAWLVSFYAGYNIVMKRKNVLHKLLCALPVTIAMPQMLQYMSTMEFSLFALAWGQTFLGAMAYVTQSPNIWPETFGYHEVMHLLTSTAALTGIALQYHLLDSFNPMDCLLASNGDEGFWTLFFR